VAVIRHRRRACQPCRTGASAGGRTSARSPGRWRAWDGPAGGRPRPAGAPLGRAATPG